MTKRDGEIVSKHAADLVDEKFLMPGIRKKRLRHGNDANTMPLPRQMVYNALAIYTIVNSSLLIQKCPVLIQDRRGKTEKGNGL